jgi:hypothetical protein
MTIWSEPEHPGILPSTVYVRVLAPLETVEGSNKPEALTPDPDQVPPAGDPFSCLGTAFLQMEAFGPAFTVGGAEGVMVITSVAEHPPWE